MLKHHRSKSAYQEGCHLLAGGVSTNIRMAEKPFPMYLERSAGARVYDMDGNEYIDFVCGFGPVVLGHGVPEVTAAVCDALERGQTFGATQPMEVQVAQCLRQMIPSLERVRFSSSGSEAVHAALRLARAYTGRHKIIKFAGHYHGWLDGVLACVHSHAAESGSGAGPQPVPESQGISPAALADLVVVPWNDVQALAGTLAKYDGEIAAVIMEPIMANTGCIEPRPGYLEEAQRLCRRHGALLIFDEIITGFRVALDGAQGYYGVRPDLSVFGKAFASGFPISVLGGRADVMELIGQGRVTHAGTFNGNVACVAAADATLQALMARGEDLYRHLRETGRRLMEGLAAAARDAGVPVFLQGPGPLFWMWFTDQTAIHDYRASARADYARYDRFSAEMLQRGVRIMPGGRWYVSAAHTEDDVDRTVEAARESLRALSPRNGMLSDDR